MARFHDVTPRDLLRACLESGNLNVQLEPKVAEMVSRDWASAEEMFVLLEDCKASGNLNFQLEEQVAEFLSGHEPWEFEGGEEWDEEDDET